MQTRSSPSLVTLHSLARQAQLERYEHLPKQDLYKRLKQQYNYDRLQRAQRLAHKRKKLEFDSEATDSDDCKSQNIACLEGQNKCWAAHQSPKKKRGGLNKLDPIMFTKVGTFKFKFLRPNGKTIQYNVDSLIDYMLSTGDFHEPETRLRFTEADLRRIDEVARSYGLKKPSVLEAKQNTEAYSEKRQRMDALLGLERCASETITEMLEVIEIQDPDLAEEGEMKLVMSIFPTFSDLYQQIQTADAEYAKHCMMHYLSFLKGPPNRPTRDELGFLQIILSFLDQLSCGRQPDFGF